MDENNSTALHVHKPATKQVLFLRIVLLLLLAFGLGIRLVDLKDPPLDFHPTRQLRAAIIARGMYYEMSPAADPTLRAEAADSLTRMETYEPPIFERLVALTYLAAGGELPSEPPLGFYPVAPARCPICGSTASWAN